MDMSTDIRLPEEGEHPTATAHVTQRLNPLKCFPPKRGRGCSLLAIERADGVSKSKVMPLKDFYVVCGGVWWGVEVV